MDDVKTGQGEFVVKDASDGEYARVAFDIDLGRVVGIGTFFAADIKASNIAVAGLWIRGIFPGMLACEQLALQVVEKVACATDAVQKVLRLDSDMLLA
jgi:hypothetical protein